MHSLTIGMPFIGELFIILWFYSPVIIPLIAALISILRHDFKDPTTKLMWVIVSIFVPVIGPILYFIIGRKEQLRFQGQ